LGGSTATSELTDLRPFDDLVGRIYADQRLSPDTREVALAMAWIKHHGQPGARDTQTVEFWAQLSELLGRDLRGPRVETLIAADAPRYQPPDLRMSRAVCVGPRLRPYHRRNLPPPTPGAIVRAPSTYIDPPPRDNRICGDKGVIEVIEYDMVTGRHRAVHRFCRRHAERAEDVRAQLTAVGSPPAPLPNTGGLLPSHFEADWMSIYARFRPGWKAPHHGVCADDWPSRELHRGPHHPRLSVVTD
jgi:hypothetical protein